MNISSSTGLNAQALTFNSPQSSPAPESVPTERLEANSGINTEATRELQASDNSSAEVGQTAVTFNGQAQLTDFNERSVGTIIDVRA